jgi:uncharacterized protein
MTSFRCDHGHRFLSAIGLACLLVGSQTVTASPAAAASFDCSKPNLASDEKAICDDRALNDADVRMVTTFDLLSGLLAMGARGSMQDGQIEWLTKRQACGADTACLRSAYEERQKELDQIYTDMPRPM